MPTKIEWSDETWNPITGCTPTSPGCDHCYAKRMANRLRGRFGYPADEPFRVTFHRDKLDQPLRWHKPRTIFVCSMGDLWHPDVKPCDRAAVIRAANTASQHRYLFLTKRPERVDNDFSGCPNFGIGVTAEDQQRANERIPILLQIPAAMRFVSLEPLLGGVNLHPWLCRYGDSNKPEQQYCNICNPSGLIDWIIAGGETGPGARPMHPRWLRSLRDQCQAAGVPFFFKQWGEWAELPIFHYRTEIGSDNSHYVRALSHYRRQHGASIVLDDRPEGWSKTMIEQGDCLSDGRPGIGKIGKKAAGRLLDGEQWNEFPEWGEPQAAAQAAKEE